MIQRANGLTRRERIPYCPKLENKVGIVANCAANVVPNSSTTKIFFPNGKSGLSIKIQTVERKES